MPMNPNSARPHSYEIAYRQDDGACGRALVVAFSPKQATAQALDGQAAKVLKITRDDDFTEDQRGYWN